MLTLRSRKLPVLVFTLFALTACEVYPDSGRWRGDVSVHNPSWSERYTCSLDVEITHTSELVSLTGLDLYCGSRSLHWSASALNRRGTGLYSGSQKVGDVYADGTVRIELANPRETDRYPNRVQRVVITWTRLGDDLLFSLTEHAGEATRVIEGRLPKGE